MHEPKSTADYRKYPKGPNFLLIVILACVAMLLVFGGAWFFLHMRASKALPHGPNPEPNSRLMLPAGDPGFGISRG